MKANGTILTKEERDVIILAGSPLGNQFPDNTQIAQHLGISVSKVKIQVYQACVKLGARNRIEAHAFALRRGEIKLDELYSHDELAELLLTLHPDILRRIVSFMYEGLGYGNYQLKDNQIIHMSRRQDTILTGYERDVLILAGRGLANREIASTLYFSIDTVRKFLNRACTKLGVSKRLDAVLLALRRGDISLGEIYTFNELLEFLIPLETESIDKIFQMLKLKLGQKPVLTSN